MAYFKSWNMQGFLNDQESIMLNILNNNIENTIITTENANRNIVSEVISSKCKMKLNKDIDTINIDINFNNILFLYIKTSFLLITL